MCIVAKIIFTWFAQIWPNRPVRFWPPERSNRLKTQVRHFTCASPQMTVLARSGYTIRILKNNNPIFTIKQTIKDNNRYNIQIWIYIQLGILLTQTDTDTYIYTTLDRPMLPSPLLASHLYTVKLPMPSITYTRGKSERLREFRAFTRLNIHWHLSEAHEEGPMNTYWWRNKGEGTQKEGLWEGLFREGPTFIRLRPSSTGGMLWPPLGKSYLSPTSLRD